MESVDYWDDSQFDSYSAFDDFMNMVVNDSIGIGDSTIEVFGKDIGMVVQDTDDDEKTIPSRDATLACLGRRKTVTLKDGAYVVVVVTEPWGEEKATITATMGGINFNLNKLSIKGMFKLDDLEREESFTEILCLLLPDFY